MEKLLHFAKGLSINDVTILGRGGVYWFCDNSTKTPVIKSVKMGGGGSKLRDVIYGRPLIDKYQRYFYY